MEWLSCGISYFLCDLAIYVYPVTHIYSLLIVSYKREVNQLNIFTYMYICTTIRYVHKIYEMMD